MIAKLIVQGPTREVAIQKLHAALSEYQIAGPITNIQFLKRVCKTPAFIAGDVETGFIAKQQSSLFEKVEIPPEVYAQAALGTFLMESTPLKPNENPALHFVGQSGFTSTFHTRIYHFAPDIYPSTAQNPIAVEIKHLSSGLFDLSINNGESTTNTYASISTNYNPLTRTLTSYYPHTRLQNRIIPSSSPLDSNNNLLTIFHLGTQHRLRIPTPGWVTKALGTKEPAHSVLAPMPCKVLRVEVHEGDMVAKDQVLVVIESMKMETVIRSPQAGRVKRVVHGQGVCYMILPYFFLFFLLLLRVRTNPRSGNVGFVQSRDGVGGI